MKIFLNQLKTTRGQLWIIIFLLAFIAFNLLVLNRNYFFPDKPLPQGVRVRTP